jgi:hypothetical protein
VATIRYFFAMTSAYPQLHLVSVIYQLSLSTDSIIPEIAINSQAQPAFSAPMLWRFQAAFRCAAPQSTVLRMA